MEDGCLSYDLHQDREDPDTLVFIETWRDHAAWRAHAMQRFRDTGAGDFPARSILHQLDNFSWYASRTVAVQPSSDRRPSFNSSRRSAGEVRYTQPRSFAPPRSPEDVSESRLQDARASRTLRHVQ